ncbi:MAG: methyl-accepting chemotaxis protein, partial [Rhizobium giardinii]
INGLIRQISGSASEQAVGLKEINTAVNQMDQVTQQNAAMVEETTAASMALNEEARALSTLVARFHVARQGQSSADMLRNTADRMRTPAKTSYGAPAKPAPTRYVAAAPKAVPQVSGNTALSQDNWEEF